MSSRKTVREVVRVYQRVAEQATQADESFEHARHAVVQRLCSPVAVALGSDPMSVELQLLEHPAASMFASSLLDEMLLWQPPDRAPLLETLLSDRQLRKRQIGQDFLERLRGSTLRLWDVVDARAGHWATVRRFGGQEPPRRVELLDDARLISKGDCVTGRRIKLGATRVFADGWLSFPNDASTFLRELEGDALLQRAFCLSALMATGDQHAFESWLGSLQRADGTSSDTNRDAGFDRHRSGSSTRPPPRRSARPATADPERERLLDRIRKLFAMAQETEASPHEAEIALRRCQSLMARFGITESDLETSEFGVSSVATGRTVATHTKLLGGAVALLHDVIFVIGRGGLAEFRGYEIDVQVATLTFDYLSQAIERALSARKQRGDLPPGRSAAFDYRVAFANEVHQRVHLIAAERETVEIEDRGDGSTLAVLKRAQVDREFGGNLVEKPLRVRGARDVDAAEAGRADGQDVSLDPQIG